MVGFESGGGDRRLTVISEPHVLSSAARSLWAKSDRGAGERWLPLFVHLCDTAAMGERLWDRWLSQGTREAVAIAFEGDAELARTVTIFLCAAHDIGKATPAFQAKRIAAGPDGIASLAWVPERAGLSVRAGVNASRPTHPISGEVILRRYLGEAGVCRRVSRSLGSVVGAHHGNPSRDVDILDALDHAKRMGFACAGDEGEAPWEAVQTELIDLARKLSGLTDDVLTRLDSCSVGAPFASIIAGLIIMADWLASNERFFPAFEPIGSDGGLVRAGCVDLSALALRASRGWAKAGIIPSWQQSVVHAIRPEVFQDRFELPQGAAIRPVQRRAIEAAWSMYEPGMLVIEAPMGEGKTEAALAAAEVMAARSGRGGICVALPTMATTDAMFGRVHAWINRLPDADSNRATVFLAHGKARLNEEYRGIAMQDGPGGAVYGMGVDLADDGRRSCLQADERAILSSWMQGRKKGMLANFVVCTVDQVLMGALQMRHLALRQLALADKVVIIDECHAYDAYMQEYLCRVLEWLAVLRTPVILLSATLPARLRDRFTGAYRRGRSAAPERVATPDSLLSGISSRRVRGGRGAHARSCGATDGKPMRSDRVDAYPVLTIATRSGVQEVAAERSSRSTRVALEVVDDGCDTLVDLLAEQLADGGCAGVVCDTVARAQAAMDALSAVFDDGELLLSHARFMDCDRMENESRLRSLLGPDSSVADGTRPRRLVVVGTQVLEQSLDIDFDVMVTDVAPVDLLFQRLGRMHRHQRGEGQSERPKGLREARCFLRGITRFASVPEFGSDISRVYEPASLMEALGVLGLPVFGAMCGLSLPDDIAPMVQRAYSEGAGRFIPDAWRVAYQTACDKRSDVLAEKRRRARSYLVQEAGPRVRDGGGLDNLFSRSADADAPRHEDDDFGPRAVRDTQESVEVLLLERRAGELFTLPWVEGDSKVEEGEPSSSEGRGMPVPTDREPDEELAATMAQCAVRLPLAMCDHGRVDRLIDVLENHCGPFVGAWQDSEWIAGRLFLALERHGERFVAEIDGWLVSYTREGGLSTVRQSDRKNKN